MLGTAAVGFVYATGARLFDRRVGLLAAARAWRSSFLPVFYSHLALNDVPALLPLMVSVYGSAGVLVHGRLRDYLIAGAGLGLAVATKYTAGIGLLPLLAAAAAAARSARAPPRGAAAARRSRSALALRRVRRRQPARARSFTEFWSDVRKQESAAGDFGKLGLRLRLGHRLLPVGPDLGPRLGAASRRRSRARSLLARATRAARCFLVPWPLLFMLYMGLQDRYFGRWLLPALPALALLAGVRGGAGWRPRCARPRAARGAARGRAALLLAARDSSTASTSTACCRATTRATSRARGWCDNVPPRLEDRRRADRAGRLVHRAGLAARPAAERAPSDAGRRCGSSSSTRARRVDEQGRKRRGRQGARSAIEDYERITRPALVGAYERGGYCWVVIGSTQYGRALAEPDEVPERDPLLPRARAARASSSTAIDPYRPGEGPERLQLRLELRLLPARLRAPRPDGARLPAARRRAASAREIAALRARIRFDSGVAAGRPARVSRQSEGTRLAGRMTVAVTDKRIAPHGEGDRARRAGPRPHEPEPARRRGGRARRRGARRGLPRRLRRAARRGGGARGLRAGPDRRDACT